MQIVIIHQMKRNRQWKNSSWPRKSSTNSCENCILCHVFSSKNLEFFSNKKSVDHNRFFKMTKTPSSSQFHALLIKKGRIRIFRNLYQLKKEAIFYRLWPGIFVLVENSVTTVMIFLSHSSDYFSFLTLISSLLQYYAGFLSIH